jgi:hypothetical protein
MSQSNERGLDEVKRVLRRIQRFASEEQIEPVADSDPKAGLSPTGHGRATPLGPNRQEVGSSITSKMNHPMYASLPIEQSAAGGQRDHLQPNLKTIAVAAVSALAGVLMVFAGVALVRVLDQQMASPHPPTPEAAPKLAVAVADADVQPIGSPRAENAPEAITAGQLVDTANRSVPRAPIGTDVASRLEVGPVAAAPRVVAPAEWSASAGHGTILPLAFAPPAEAHNHHVLVSGLEASAFVIKGVEIIEGTWMLRATDLAEAMIVRDASAPGKTRLTIELRTDPGRVVSRTELVLLGPSIEPGANGAAPPSPTVSSSTIEAARLVQQARQLLSRGELVNARLLLEHATDLGNADAALELGGTYDSNRSPSNGAHSNREVARAWYDRAAALGSEEASRRIAAMPPS